MIDHESIASHTRRWVEQFVVAQQLCPFARREVERDSIRYCVTAVTEPFALLDVLRAECQLLEEDASIETTLIIHPRLLTDFLAYNDFLDSADQLLESLNLTGVFQIASFHPNYQFAGTSPDDAENYSNRSPYPMLHILREDSLTRAIDSYPDIDAVPERNIQRLNTLGAATLAEQLEALRSR